MSVFFCRHAESTFNSRGDNSPDVPLSANGEGQARRLSGHFNLVLCSPMRRAQQTLTLSAITYERLDTMPELREGLNETSDLLPGESADLLDESHAQLTARTRLVKERIQRELLEAATAAAASSSPSSPQPQSDFRVLLVSHLFLGQALFKMCGAGQIHLPNARITPLPLNHA